MSRLKSLMIVLLFTSWVLASCSLGTNTRNEITISAAASLKDSLLDVKTAFEEEYPEVKITYNFGSTGALRKQIEQGAPIDGFLSASSSDYNKLKEMETIYAGELLFTNELVLVTKKNSSSISSLEDVVISDDKLAIGTPTIVPAGFYAKEALEYFDLWENLQARLVYGKDVTHVLTLIEHGAATAAIVYKSEVVNKNDFTVIHEFDPQSHSRIDYYAAVVTSSEQQEIATDFQKYLLTENSLNIFEKQGFNIEVSR
ncbi:molybdate ABC transporter substrate-binding protein [Bacillus sp. 2205SS5-2]|uniref:molybdate ABC transporter substrate-binding protein n=1 Tax=Bacillus sp. 2205SS5-2 TaxID=3109031 RepID=UPI0030053099